MDGRTDGRTVCYFCHQRGRAALGWSLVGHLVGEKEQHSSCFNLKKELPVLAGC